jgi:choline dehydrogenase-like flavoprotein
VLRSAETSTPGTTVRADVCVVGAGPAGLTVAHELASSGLQVLVLEAGPAAPPPGGQDVSGTRNVGLAYSPESTRSAGLGGSSLRWRVGTPLGPDFVRLKELDELDFEKRDAIAATGWPLSRSTLEPYYRRAWELFGVTPPDAREDEAVAEHLERRVYSFAAATVFTAQVPGVLRQHPRVTLLTDATVTEIQTDERPNHVSGLACRSGAGTAFTVEAKAYVLAGGGIENARLLLASRATKPAGLGNTHDQVGRHFMEHPHYFSGVIVPAGEHLGSTADAWQIVAERGQARQSKYALDPDILRREGLLNAAYKVASQATRGRVGFGQDGGADQTAVDAFVAVRSAVRRRSPRAVSGTHLASLAAAAPSLARWVALRSADRLHLTRRPLPVREGFRLSVMAEQEPSPASRVRLTSEPDRFGVPLAELDWRLSPLDLTSMAQGQRLAGPGLEAVLHGRVISTLGPVDSPRIPKPRGGAHHMGTTRMSTYPRDGVVDDTCRVHGIRNLYVAGSSVFPTGGAANPTLTLVALASRLAAHLADELC